MSKDEYDTNIHIKYSLEVLRHTKELESIIMEYTDRNSYKTNISLLSTILGTEIRYICGMIPESREAFDSIKDKFKASYKLLSEDADPFYPIEFLMDFHTSHHLERTTPSLVKQIKLKMKQLYSLPNVTGYLMKYDKSTNTVSLDKLGGKTLTRKERNFIKNFSDKAEEIADILVKNTRSRSGEILPPDNTLRTLYLNAIYKNYPRSSSFYSNRYDDTKLGDNIFITNCIQNKNYGIHTKNIGIVSSNILLAIEARLEKLIFIIQEYKNKFGKEGYIELLYTFYCSVSPEFMLFINIVNKMYRLFENVLNKASNIYKIIDGKNVIDTLVYKTSADNPEFSVYISKRVSLYIRYIFNFIPRTNTICDSRKFNEAYHLLTHISKYSKTIKSDDIGWSIKDLYNKMKPGEIIRIKLQDVKSNTFITFYKSNNGKVYCNIGNKGIRTFFGRNIIQEFVIDSQESIPKLTTLYPDKVYTLDTYLNTLKDGLFVNYDESEIAKGRKLIKRNTKRRKHTRLSYKPPYTKLQTKKHKRRYGHGHKGNRKYKVK